MAASATAASSVAPHSEPQLRVPSATPEATTIFFCCHEPVWPLSGGGTSGNLAILRELKATGLKPVAVMPYNGQLMEARRATGVRLEPFRPFRMHRNAPFRTLRYALYSILYLFKLILTIRDIEPAMLICRNSVVAVPVNVAARLFRLPTAIVLSDLLSFSFWTKRTRPPLWQRVFRSFECRVVASYDRIFVVTPAMADEIAGHAGKEVRSKISVTRDGIHDRFLALTDEDFSTARRIRRSICGNAPLAVFYGTLERHHGMQELNRIVRQLLRKASDFHVLIIGAGPCQRSFLRGPLAGEPRVRLFDFMDTELLIHHALAADVGMIPYPAIASTDMVYTFKFLEYVCLGLPIVAFPLETLRREFSGHPGLHLATDDEDFVNAVVRFGRSGRRYPPEKSFMQRFSWRQVAAPIVHMAKEKAAQRVVHVPEL